MIRLLLFSFSYLFIIISCPHSVNGQQNEKEILYLKVDYFKTTGTQIAEYLDAELQLWRPIHQERLEQGIIKSWDLYSVIAAESNAPYNFITINVFEDFSMIDYYDLDNIIRSVYPEKDPDEVIEHTRKLREVVRTEIWEVNGRIMKDGQNSPGGNYLTINYFDARGGSGEHEEMELDFWGQIHHSRIDRNILNSWAMYSLLYPGGDSRQYTYSTIDYYDNLGDLQEPVGMALARVAHPDLNEAERNDFFTRTSQSRTLFKTELWKRVSFLGPVHK